MNDRLKLMSNGGASGHQGDADPAHVPDSQGRFLSQEACTACGATSFEEVQYGDLLKLPLTDDLIDLPLDSDDTIVLFTAEGNYFKIGNAELAGDFTVSFNFQQLCPPGSDDDHLTD